VLVLVSQFLSNHTYFDYQGSMEKDEIIPFLKLEWDEYSKIDEEIREQYLQEYTDNNPVPTNSNDGSPYPLILSSYYGSRNDYVDHEIQDDLDDFMTWFLGRNSDWKIVEWLEFTIYPPEW